MSTSFLHHLATWAEKRDSFSDPQNNEQAAILLQTLADTLRDIPFSYAEIMKPKDVEEEVDFSSVDLAKILQLLTHSEVEYQRQGVEFLIQSDSKDFWDTIMIGASITRTQITHSTLKVSGALKTALLLNPYLDYSNFTSLTLTAPFPQDLECLKNCSNLTKLIVKGPSPNFSFRGLSNCTQLRELEIYDYRGAALFSEENVQCLQAVQNLVVEAPQQYSRQVKDFPYKMVDQLPNIKHLKLTNVIIDYAQARFTQHPELHIKITSHPSEVLPNTKSNLTVTSLEVVRKSEFKDPVDMRIFQNCSVQLWMLPDTTSKRVLYCTHVFSLLNAETIPTLQGSQFSWGFQTEFRLHRMLMSPETSRMKILDFKSRVENNQIADLVFSSRRYDEISYLNISSLTIKMYGSTLGELSTHMPPSLRHLILQAPGVSMYNYEWIESLTMLEKLEVHQFFNLNSRGLRSHFTKLTNLKELVCVNCWGVKENYCRTLLQKKIPDLNFIVKSV